MTESASRHPTRPELVPASALRELLAADLRLLGNIEVGVATSSFQTEGGIDGPGEPVTNWRQWAASGRLEPIGPACDLWRRFDEVVSRCRGMGLHAFRMSIEWARVAPSGAGMDTRAVVGYADRFAKLRAAGIEPIVTMHHFTHPAWLGADFWLDDRAPTTFASYVADVMRTIGDAMVRRGQRPVDRILTINEPNMLALATYLGGMFPHRRGALSDGDLLGGPRAFRALDHMMSAHVLAYRALHALYAERGWPTPDVSWNQYFLDVYGLARLPLDIMRGGEAGIPVRGLARYAETCRDEFYRDFCGDESSPRVETARAIDKVWSRFVSPEIFHSLLSVLRARPDERPFDYVALDLYDPWSRQQLRGGEAMFSALSSGAPILGLQALLPVNGVALAEPWEWQYEPMTVGRAVRSMQPRGSSLPVDVMENGMAERRPVGESHGTRSDGITRPEFIRGYAFGVAHARVVEKLPVRTYCYWTLVDNYELGRYIPRFGVYALPDPPRPRTAATWSHRDAGGNDSAAALAQFAATVTTARRDPEGAREAVQSFFGAE